MLFAVSFDHVLNERKVKNIHIMPAIIAVLKYIPKWFSFQYTTQPVIDSEMSAGP